MTIKWSWVFSHGALFEQLLGQHLYLAAMPLLYGILVSLPLGMACVRWPRLYPSVLASTTVLYALPSIALFVVLIDFTGLTATTAIIPLTIYTLAILVRNVVDGLRSVPQPVRQAAEAMGFGPGRRLVEVDLPLALPVILGGLRVAAVSNISLVSIAALIGLGGLGQLFTAGFEIGFPTEIAAGIVLTVALAFVADVAIVAAQRLLTPWTRAQEAS